MTRDRVYCTSKTCIHRRGCLRALVNYSKEQQQIARVFIDNIECETDFTDKNNTNDFQYLIRFRGSNGEEL